MSPPREALALKINSDATSRWLAGETDVGFLP